MKQNTDEKENINDGESKKFSSFDIRSLIIGITGSLIASLIITIPSTINSLVSIPKRLSAIEESLEEHTSCMSELSQRFDSFETELNNIKDKYNEIDKEHDEFNKKYNELNDKIFNIVLYSPTSNASKVITQTYESIRKENFAVNLLWNNNDKIAINTITNESYNASQLSNQKLLMNYINNHNQEVIFYGQFNENNHWDGNCIINVYTRESELILVTEALYNDGILVKYNQAYLENQNYYISTRTHNQSYNQGETWQYSCPKGFIKTFDFQKAAVENIVNIELLKLVSNLKLLAYYYGNTSDGSYNDQSGESYYISYADDGTVKTLYKGGFKNGRFYDTTAWYITKEKDTDYMYYIGGFENGSPLNNEGSYFENNLSNERIKDILENNNCYLDLKWYDSANDIITNESNPI